MIHETQDTRIHQSSAGIGGHFCESPQDPSPEQAGIPLISCGGTHTTQAAVQLAEGCAGRGLEQ